MKHSRSAFIESALITLLLISTYYSDFDRQEASFTQGSNSIQIYPSQQSQPTSQRF